MENIPEFRKTAVMLDAHDAEFSRMRRWLAGAREAAAVVGLCGPAGVGKTAAAQRLAREHADGRSVYVVHAHGRSTAALVDECARVVGGKPAVVVLDDVSEDVRFELLGAPGTLIVMTSRAALRAPTIDLRAWSSAAAVRLLALRSGVNERDAALPNLCALVHHLPLAVELVAAALADARTLLPSDVARQVDEERERLVRRALVIDDALGLETALNFVYRRMSVMHQRALRQLALIDGAFDAAMAAAVSAEADVLAADLCRRRLLEMDEERSVYRMPRAVRDYARARLSNSEAEAARMRYVESMVLRARVLKRRFVAGDEAGAAAGFDALRRHVEAAFAATQPEFHVLPGKAARLLADLTEALQELLPRCASPAAVRTWQRARVDALHRVRDVRGEIAARERLCDMLVDAGDEPVVAECRREIERLQEEWAVERRSLDLLSR